jgi:hypothetical protein
MSYSYLNLKGLHEAEEDEWLMAHICLSQLVMFFFPLAGGVLNPLVFFDKCHSGDITTREEEKEEKETNTGGMVLPLSVRREIFRYYKECVQRHLYVRSKCLRVGNGDAANSIGNDSSQGESRVKIFLSKNPPFTMRLKSLYETFPDCRIVCMLRDPVQSVPSMVSYIAQVLLLWGLCIIIAFV